MNAKILSRRSLLQAIALAAPFSSLAACGEPTDPPPVIPPEFEEDALLLERYYSPELIPQLQEIGTHHVSDRTDAEVQLMIEDAVRLLRSDPDEETAFDAVDAMIVDDFRSLRVEDVGGWTLSTSETNLAVLSLALVLPMMP